MTTTHRLTALTAAADHWRAELAAAPDRFVAFRAASNLDAVEAKIAKLAPPPAECEHCGDDFEMSDFDFAICGCDIRSGAGDRFLTWRPCCEGNRADVELVGFEATYGRSVADVVAMIAPDLDVVEICDDVDACIVARLEVRDPAEPGKADELGRRKATSPKGWRGEIFAEVDEHHRHHDPPVGHKFSVACDNGGIRVGVAVVSRPVSRRLAKAEPLTLEVTRVATWGASPLRKNVSSKLYASAAKKARALGYEKVITYTIADVESGHSLIASGWTPTHRSRGGSWNRRGRPRTDKAPTSAKIRWEKGLTKNAKREVAARGAAFAG